MPVKAEIINIGDELLIGQIVNTNASWMSEQLNLAGIMVYQVSMISDNREHIIEALNTASAHVDLILITGGLGPTKDDITKETLCDYFDSKLEFNEQAFISIREFFARRGKELTEINRKQAEIPDNCIPIPNLHGTSPGMWFEKEGKIFVSMPGVPYEMQPMITGFVIPRIFNLFNRGNIIHKTILTQGMGESFIARRIENWENKLPTYIKLAYLPQPGLVRLRLSASGEDKEAMINELNFQVEGLKQIIPELIFGFDGDTLESLIGGILREKGLSISTAESCTGGYIAHLITSVTGSSDYYKGSVVAYSNEIKKSVLGVSEESLITYGAVSEAVVIEMARGVRERLNTDLSIAVSGIAGPDGATPDKPLGTTWIAIDSINTCRASHFLFGEHRMRNIQMTALTALNMLRKELLNI